MNRECNSLIIQLDKYKRPLLHHLDCQRTLLHHLNFLEFRHSSTIFSFIVDLVQSSLYDVAIQVMVCLSFVSIVMESYSKRSHSICSLNCLMVLWTFQVDFMIPGVDLKILQHSDILQYFMVKHVWTPLLDSLLYED